MKIPLVNHFFFFYQFGFDLFQDLLLTIYLKNDKMIKKKLE